MSQKLPINNFEWMEDISQFNEDFIKKYNGESNEKCFLEVDVQCLQNDLPFLPERTKIEKVKKLLANLHNVLMS